MAETTMQVLKNGPLLVKGPIKLVNAEGQPVPTQGEQAALCRCGASANKPFCDGAHKKINFQG